MSWFQSIPFLAHLKRRDRDRLARYNIVIAILLAGWFPSILMLVVSYTILNSTLESKILHDRQAFVQLIAHLVADDLSHTGSVIEYYQSQPDVAKMLVGPTPRTSRPAMADPDVLFASAHRRHVYHWRRWPADRFFAGYSRRPNARIFRRRFGAKARWDRRTFIFRRSIRAYRMAVWPPQLSARCERRRAPSSAISAFGCWWNEWGGACPPSILRTERFARWSIKHGWPLFANEFCPKHRSRPRAIGENHRGNSQAKERLDRAGGQSLFLLRHRTTGLDDHRRAAQGRRLPAGPRSIG